MMRNTLEVSSATGGHSWNKKRLRKGFGVIEKKKGEGAARTPG